MDPGWNRNPVRATQQRAGPNASRPSRGLRHATLRSCGNDRQNPACGLAHGGGVVVAAAADCAVTPGPGPGPGPPPGLGPRNVIGMVYGSDCSNVVLFIAVSTISYLYVLPSCSSGM